MTRLLLGVDLRDDNDTAVERAAHLAEALEAQLDLAFVAPSDTPRPERLDTLLQEIPEAQRGEAQQLTGDPAQTLTTAALGYDGILVATRGGPGFDDLHLGKVATAVLKTAPVPVTILSLEGPPPPQDLEDELNRVGVIVGNLVRKHPDWLHRVRIGARDADCTYETRQALTMRLADAGIDFVDIQLVPGHDAMCVLDADFEPRWSP